MAAFWYDETTTVSRYQTMTVTTSATATTTMVYIYANEPVSNWVTVYEEPPPPEQDYLVFKKPSFLRALERQQRPIGRCVIAALPRGKLTRWKSLKEKRQAWGIQ